MHGLSTFDTSQWSPKKLKSLAATLSLILSAALALTGPLFARG